MDPAEDVASTVIDTAIKVHRRLGPGLYEAVYEVVLARSLVARGLEVQRQHCVAFDFEGMHFARGLRVDLLVNKLVVVEIKARERLSRVHAMQLLTYLRLMHLRVGLVLNFGAPTMKEGIRRVVNGYPLP